MSTFTPGANLSPVAAPVQQTLANNYLDFATGWAQQYLPELYEAEVERYGNRMLSGLLAKVGAEEAMASDKVIWSEQGRLHLTVTTAASADIAADNLTFSSAADAALIRKYDTVLLYCTACNTSGNVGKSIKCLVTVVNPGGDATKHTVIPYTQATLDASGGSAITFTTGSVFRVMVYGNEHRKGVELDRPALTPSFQNFSNKPIIIRDRYQINGSDAAQIGWVEVSGEEGQSGYMWYLKAEGDTRARFNDYLEMSMLESVRATGAQLDGATLLGTGGTNEEEGGTEGLFEAIEKRGHVCQDTFVGAFTTDMATVDAMLVKFDKEGAIEENMMYLDRTESLNLDDMLGNIGAGHAAAAGFGMFNNSADMALNLGFSGFRRGSYDFYKTDWKYLNDQMAHGGMTDGLAGKGSISGVVIPAGVTSVYDQGMGRNIKRPFLHVRYRASQNENRKLKTWITGSVGGNITSDLDAMQVNYLSERCLVVQAANNFMLLKN